jgi:hypothetical protein
MAEWREIPGFEGYEVSDTGLIRSYWKGRSGLQDRPSRMLTQTINWFGHAHVVLSDGGKQHCFGVHRIVALAFIGDLAPGMDVHHKNGDPMDNRLCNLEVLSHKKNIQRITKRKKPLDLEQVLDIRHRRRDGESVRDIANDYGVSHTCISQISRGKSYPEAGGPLTVEKRGWS